MDTGIITVVLNTILFVTNPHLNLLWGTRLDDHDMTTVVSKMTCMFIGRKNRNCFGKIAQSDINGLHTVNKIQRKDKRGAKLYFMRKKGKYSNENDKPVLKGGWDRSIEQK